MVYFARFLERLHGFFGKLRNCLCMLFLCLDSLSLPFYVCVWALKLPYHSSWVFCTKKNTLSKKIACRAKMALALCLPMLSPASSKGLRPDVRSRSLLSAGHSATLWTFCTFNVFMACWCCKFPLGSSGFVVVIFFPRHKDWTPQKLFEAFTHFGRGRRWNSGLFTLSKLECSKQASCQNIALHMSAWDNGTRLEVSFRRFFLREVRVI